MWLINVVLIITFIYFIICILRNIKKQNRIFMYVLIDVAVICEVIFIWYNIVGWSIPVFLQILILVFSYIIPMTVTIFNSTDVSFRLKILYAVARATYTFRKYELAAGLLEGAIRKDKQNVKYYSLRAKALEKMGDTTGARDMLFNVVELDKYNKEAYIKLAELLDYENKKDTALVMLAQVLKLYPDYTLAKEMIGIIYSEIGRDKEAQSIYEELLDREDATYNTYYNLGIIYSKQKEYTKAVEMYLKAIEKNNKLYDAYYALGILYYALEEYEQSIECLKQAIKEDLLKAKAAYNLALGYIKTEEYEKAGEYLDLAVKQDIVYLEKAKREKLFDIISLEITRLEDETRELVSVSYDLTENVEQNKN